MYDTNNTFVFIKYYNFVVGVFYKRVYYLVLVVIKMNRRYSLDVITNFFFARVQGKLMARYFA